MNVTTREHDPASELADSSTRMLPDDWKVQVAGRVSMGSELRLTESIEPRIETSRFVVGLPDDGSLSGMDSFDLLGVPGRLPADRLTWTLMPEDRDIGIEADGLVASYGIFGAPGSGKTYLVMHLFRQLMEIQIDNPDQRFGGLILDPKAGLIGSVTTAMTAVNRSADLTVLSPATVSRPGKGVNIIDCGLDPAELGHLLVLAAQSAGVGASEPYWFGAWKSLFTAALPLLAWYDTTVTTLAGLMDVVLTVEPTGASGASERRIQRSPGMLALAWTPSTIPAPVATWPRPSTRSTASTAKNPTVSPPSKR